MASVFIVQANQETTLVNPGESVRVTIRLDTLHKGFVYVNPFSLSCYLLLGNTGPNRAVYLTSALLPLNYVCN